MREYREENRDAILAKARERRNANLELYRRREAAKYAANKATYIERSKQRYAANPEGMRAKTRKSRLLRTYGLTPEALAAMLALQGNRCACCGVALEAKRRDARRGNYPCVDHCHRTGVIRGILCSLCNTGLGKLGDNEAGLMRAILYLRGSRGTAGTSEGLLF
jgi:hypothetical protein